MSDLNPEASLGFINFQINLDTCKYVVQITNPEVTKCFNQGEIQHFLNPFFVACLITEIHTRLERGGGGGPSLIVPAAPVIAPYHRG